MKYRGKGYDIDIKFYELEDVKGYIKELDTNNYLIFEGEYPKGKGKEYFKDKKTKFEGDFINGIKINGIGYDTNKNIIYKLKI